MYCQNIKTELEEIELKRVYFDLIKWVIECGKHEFTDFNTEAIRDKAEEYFKKYLKNSQYPIQYTHKFSKYSDKIMNHEDKYRRKYIILHIALYLTSAVDNEGLIGIRNYSPMCRKFLMNFLNKLLPRLKANILIQTIEKST